MKVFWSWQSDTPGKIGRHFVRDALQAAIERLKETPVAVPIFPSTCNRRQVRSSSGCRPTPTGT